MAADGGTPDAASTKPTTDAGATERSPGPPASRAERRRRSRRRGRGRWRRRLLVGGGLLLFVGVGLGGAAELVRRGDAPRSIVRDQLEQALGLPVELDGFRVSWGGVSEIEGLRIGMPLRDGTAVSIDSMRIEHAAIVPLALTRQLGLVSIEVVDPAVTLDLARGDHVALQEVLAARFGGGRAADAEASAPSGGGPVGVPEVSVRGLAVRLTGLVPDEPQRTVSIEDASIAVTPIGGLQSEVDVRLPDLLTVAGRVHGAAPWTHELEFTIAPQADLASLLPAAVGAAPRVTGSLVGRIGDAASAAEADGGRSGRPGGLAPGTVTAGAANAAAAAPPASGWIGRVVLDDARAAGATARGPVDLTLTAGTIDIAPAGLTVALPPDLAEPLDAVVKRAVAAGLLPDPGPAPILRTVASGRMVRAADGIVRIDELVIDAPGQRVAVDGLVDVERGRAGVHLDLAGGRLDDPSAAMPTRMATADAEPTDGSPDDGATDARSAGAGAGAGADADAEAGADAQVAAAAGDPEPAGPSIDGAAVAGGAPDTPGDPAASVRPAVATGAAASADDAVDVMDLVEAQDQSPADADAPTGLAVHATVLATWAADGAWTIDAVLEGGARADAGAGAGAMRVRGAANVDGRQQWRVIADDVVVDRGGDDLVGVPPLVGLVRSDASDWTLESLEWMPAGTAVARPNAAWLAVRQRVLTSDEPGIGPVAGGSAAGTPGVDRPGRRPSDAAARQWATQDVRLGLSGTATEGGDTANLRVDAAWTGDVRELMGGLWPAAAAASDAGAEAAADEANDANRLTLDLSRRGGGPIDAGLSGLVGNAAMAGRGRWAPDAARPLELDVSIRPRAGDQFQTPVDGWAVAELDADLKVSGRFDPMRFDAAGSVRLAGVTAGDEVVGDIDTTLLARGLGRRLTFSVDSADVLGGPASLEGTWATDTGQIESTFELASDPRRVPWKQILPPSIAAITDVRTLGPVRVEFAFDPGTDAVVAPSVTPTTDVRVVTGPMALAVGGVELALDRTNGHVVDAGDGLVVEAFEAVQGASRVTAHGTVRRGASATPTNATSLDVVFTDWPLALPAEDAAIRLDGGFVLREATAETPALAAPIRALDPAARATVPMPSGAPRRFGEDAAPAGAELELVGDADLRVRARMAGRDVADVHVDARITPEALQLHALSGTVLDGELDGAGRVDLSDPYASNLVVDLVAARPDRVAFVWPPAAAVTGMLNGRVEIGPATDPRAPAGVHLLAAWEPVDLAVSGLALGPGALAGHHDPVSNRTVLRNATLEVAGGRLDAWGRVSPNPSGRTAFFELAATDLDLAILGERFLPDQPMVGLVGAKVSGTAPISDVTRAFGQGTIELSKSDLGAVPVFSEIYGLLNLDFVRKDPTGTGVGQFRLEEGALIVPDLRYQNRGAQVILDVRVNDVLAGSASGVRGNVRASQSLLPEVDFLRSVNDALGALQRDVLNVRLDGTLANPVIRSGSFLDLGSGK